eukprot:4517899-Prymnesium_polylepis.1
MGFRPADGRGSGGARLSAAAQTGVPPPPPPPRARRRRRPTRRSTPARGRPRGVTWGSHGAT